LLRSSAIDQPLWDDRCGSDCVGAQYPQTNRIDCKDAAAEKLLAAGSRWYRPAPPLKVSFSLHAFKACFRRRGHQGRPLTGIHGLDLSRRTTHPPPGKRHRPPDPPPAPLLPLSRFPAQPPQPPLPLNPLLPRITPLSITSRGRRRARQQNRSGSRRAAPLHRGVRPPSPHPADAAMTGGRGCGPRSTPHPPSS
jgi:hypothetical protein